MDFRSLSGEAQEAIRRRAVDAVLSGRTRTETAALLGVSRQAVSGWMKLYQSDGRSALKAGRRGRPKGSSLLGWQAAQIVRTVTERHPDQLRLPFFLWTREAVGQLLEDRFGIRVSVWTVGRYLARWGFTPQKPIRRAFEQNPVAVQRWVEEEYPEIRKRAKREKAEIYWGDEMGLRSDHTVGRSFSPKGQTPVIPGTGQRFGCNMISVITNRGQLNFMVFRDRFRAPVFIEFLKRLLRQVPRKIFLIVDGHPVHRSARVRDWVNEHNDRLQLFFLPGYSPELNPDENLNQDVKSNAVGRKRARNQQELIGHVRRYLWSRQRQPSLVKRYFREPHVQYAAT